MNEFELRVTLVDELTKEARDRLLGLDKLTREEFYGSINIAIAEMLMVIATELWLQRNGD